MSRGEACKRFLVSALLALALAPLPAAAQTTPIPLGDNATWRQDDAEFEFPPRVAGLTRTKLVDYGEQRLDVAATYDDVEGRTYATVYLFRPAIPDAAMWHERALLSIRPHETLGTPDHGSANTTVIAPRGGEVPTALLTTMPLTGKKWVSTGLVVFQHQDWLVKMRMSSQMLTPAELATGLNALVDGLVRLDSPRAQGPLAPMTSCSSPLNFKTARRARKPEMGDILAISLLAQVAEQVKSAEEPEAKSDHEPLPSNSFCRDAASGPDFGIYRREGSNDSYVLALGDAGLSATVQRDSLAGLLGGSDDSPFWITRATPYETATYRGFRSLPAPKQVLEILEREDPVSRVVVNAEGGSQVEISTP